MKGEQRMSLDGIRIGFCMTGSFCTFEKAFAAAERLVQQGAKLVPIMSFNAASIHVLAQRKKTSNALKP